MLLTDFFVNCVSLLGSVPLSASKPGERDAAQVTLNRA